MNRPLALCATAAVITPLALIGCGGESSTATTQPASTGAIVRQASMAQSRTLVVTNQLAVDVTLDVPSTSGSWIGTPGPEEPVPHGLVGTLAAGATISPYMRYDGKGQKRSKANAAPDAQFTLSVTPKGGEAVTIPFSMFGRWSSTTKNKRKYWSTTDIAWTPTAGGFQTGCTPLAPQPITYSTSSGTATGTIAVTCGGGGRASHVTVAPG